MRLSVGYALKHKEKKKGKNKKKNGTPKNYGSISGITEYQGRKQLKKIGSNIGQELSRINDRYYNRDPASSKNSKQDK